MNLKPMLNAYPDSLGGTLGDIVTLLGRNELKEIFGSFYILPSLYHSDLDRGFSVIDYDINEELATQDDLKRLKQLGIDPVSYTHLSSQFWSLHCFLHSIPFR